MDLTEQLQKLHALREQGVLTEEEFTKAKAHLIDGLAPADKPAATRSTREPGGQSTLHQFRRSISDRWIGGVCGGLAEISSIPSWTWRILFALTILLHGLGVVVYLLLWIFVPLALPVAAPAATSNPTQP